MYCIKCGVELADTEKICPLCQTKVYHPDIALGEGEPLYPENKYPQIKKRTFIPQALLIFAFAFPIIIVLMCDIRFNYGITWSGYVIGALLLGYICVGLPTWFVKPNPVIFVPCDFAAAGIYILYINLVTDGAWFLSFALPVLVAVAVIVVTVVTLVHYVKRGKLFIFGGASIAMGALMLLMEFLLCFTFDGVNFIGWSLYPLVSLLFIGGVLIFLGICRPARENMVKKLFI